jgi:polyketide biosynthesis acyl carrier protein
MNKDEVFKIVKEAIAEVIEEQDEEISIDKDLKYYGANSIDRADISMLAMEKMGCKIPLIQFGTVKNIQGLVDVLFENQNAK